MGLTLRNCAFILAGFSFFVLAINAQNKVLGELQLEGSSRIEKTSGVWIDGQYLGYVDELKGSKKILLLPGTHKLSVRQNGFRSSPAMSRCNQGRSNWSRLPWSRHMDT